MADQPGSGGGSGERKRRQRPRKTREPKRTTPLDESPASRGGPGVAKPAGPRPGRRPPQEAVPQPVVPRAVVPIARAAGPAAERPVRGPAHFSDGPQRTGGLPPWLFTIALPGAAAMVFVVLILLIIWPRGDGDEGRKTVRRSDRKAKTKAKAEKTSHRDLKTEDTDSIQRGNRKGASANGPSRQARAAPKPSAATVTAESLRKEFKTDAAAAKKKYTGKTLRVSGRVEFPFDMHRNPPRLSIGVLEEDSHDVKGQVVCMFFPAEEKKLLSMYTGQKIVVRGSFANELAGIPLLYECTVEEIGPPIPIIAVDTGELAKAYKKDEGAADKQYKGKLMLLEGVVIKTRKVGVVAQKIQIRSADTKTDDALPIAVDIGTNSDQIDQVKKMKPGDPVRVKGFCSGMMLPGLGNGVELSHARLVGTTEKVAGLQEVATPKKPIALPEDKIGAPSKPAAPVAAVPKDVKVITNSIGMKLALIPAGTFEMGNHDTPQTVVKGFKKSNPRVRLSQDISEYEYPAHRVTISESFHIGIYEVTQAEYEKVMGTNPSSFSPSGKHKGEVTGTDTSRFPVELVHWRNAVEFCEKLSNLPEEKAAGRAYRLPTEAEWEYACRAGTTTAFHYGDSLSPSQANFDGKYPFGGPPRGESSNRPTTVGSYRRNAFGLFDMHGNVREWCFDRMRKDYYKDSPQKDPLGPITGTHRVTRGGSWYDYSFKCRSTSRNGEKTDWFNELGPPFHYRSFDTGFRVVAVSPASLEKLAARRAAAGKRPLPKHVKVIANSIGMKLVAIPAGEFMMGSPDSEKGRKSDETQHRVRITKPFHMGQFEVTQAEYRKVMRKNPNSFSRNGTNKLPVQGMDTSRFPVEMVAWKDAVAFCRRLSNLPAEKKAKRTYRLPTEAEWEYACRAGTTTVFNFGDDLNGIEANCRGIHPYGTWNVGPFLKRTTEVGSYSPNAFGLYDMHGNVWEWCADWYRLEYYAKSPPADPKGPGAKSLRKKSRQEHVRRGGAWDWWTFECRSAFRGRLTAHPRRRYTGFRVVMVGGPAGSSKARAGGGQDEKPTRGFGGAKVTPGKPVDASPNDADLDSKRRVNTRRPSPEEIEEAILGRTGPPKGPRRRREPPPYKLPKRKKVSGPVGEQAMQDLFDLLAEAKRLRATKSFTVDKHKMVTDAARKANERLNWANEKMTVPEIKALHARWRKKFKNAGIEWPFEEFDRQLEKM